MRCGELTRMSVFVGGPRDTVAQCAQAMRRHDIGFLPIVDDEGRPLGVVTDRDLTLRVLAEGMDPMTPVAEVMSRGVAVCRLMESLDLAEERMVAAGLTRLPVVDDGGRCVGVLSFDDIVQAESRHRAGELCQELTRPRVVRRR